LPISYIKPAKLRKLPLEQNNLFLQELHMVNFKKTI
jgi:hypothetical protein